MTPAAINANIPRLYKLERAGQYPPPALEAAAGEAMKAAAKHYPRAPTDRGPTGSWRDYTDDGLPVLSEGEESALRHACKGDYKRTTEHAATIGLRMDDLRKVTAALKRLGLIVLDHDSEGEGRGRRVIIVATPAGRRWAGAGVVAGPRPLIRAGVRLSTLQGKVLRHAVANDFRRLAAVAADLAVNMAQLTRLTDALDRKGLVNLERIGPPGNRRITVSATDAGREWLAAANPERARG